MVRHFLYGSAALLSQVDADVGDSWQVVGAHAVVDLDAEGIAFVQLQVADAIEIFAVADAVLAGQPSGVVCYDAPDGVFADMSAGVGGSLHDKGQPFIGECLGGTESDVERIGSRMLWRDGKCQGVVAPPARFGCRFVMVVGVVVGARRHKQQSDDGGQPYHRPADGTGLCRERMAYTI